jgi:hypothetical protein
MNFKNLLPRAPADDTPRPLPTTARALAEAGVRPATFGTLPYRGLLPGNEAKRPEFASRGLASPPR